MKNSKDYLTTVAMGIGFLFAGITSFFLDRFYPEDAHGWWFVGSVLICLAMGVIGFVSGGLLSGRIWSKFFNIKD